MRRILGKNIYQRRLLLPISFLNVNSQLSALTTAHLNGCTAEQRRSFTTENNSVSATHNDEGVFTSAIRHVLSELPVGGLRLVDVQSRLRNVMGDAEKADPKRYGYDSLIQALVTANDSHYLSDDIVVPCDWERVLSQVRAKLPSGGVLEPALIRYINAEGCPRFRRGNNSVGIGSSSDLKDEAAATDDVSTGMSSRDAETQTIKAQLKVDNPSGASLPGVALHEWIQTHFGKLIEVVDVTPSSVLERAAANGTFPSQTFVYRPVEDVHPFVEVLRTAFKCLGCTNPQHMPIVAPLQSVAAIVPILPQNPKTGHPYTWPEFLQVPEVKEHFETNISIFVSEQKTSQTQIIFVDGTTLQPDEAEAAVHQWRARRSGELGRIPVKVNVIVVRREDDPPHSNDDIIIDGYVVDASHAIVARLALIADTETFSTAIYNDPFFGTPRSASASSSSSVSSSEATSADAVGWSAVRNDSDSLPSASGAFPQPNMAVRRENPFVSSSLVSQSLSSAEDETEVSIATAAEGTDASSSANVSFPQTSSDSKDVLNTSGSLMLPSLPATLCAPEVVVLVGSRDSKERLDSDLVDVNSVRHWVRTMLVVGE